VQKGYRQRIGKMGERIAVRFLKKNGYEILEKNYRFQRGEIDIIAKKGEEIIFVEVKTKMRGTFGEPEDRVGISKQRQIARVAMGYLQSKNIFNVNCRFDVISVTGVNKDVHHIKDAFWLEDTNIDFK
jgi:putative endonuclease